jgi:hypothetical protein
MKKLLLVLAGGMLLLTACQKNVNQNSVTAEEQTATHRICAATEVLEAAMAEDPELRTRMDNIEKFTRQFLQNKEAFRKLANGTIEIPVVFNVLYNTAEQNISLEQLQSQIDVLNEDFGATNSDYNNTPSLFTAVRSGNIGVTFVLDAVVRKKTNKKSWTTNDAMKKSNQGGIPPTSPSTKLNIWVCNLSGGVLGYAQFPGGSASTDGVVLDDNATGRTGTATAPFNKGRTATHEVGHYLNLRHIWGDTNCGNDFVDDTPVHTTYNFGCPPFPTNSSCGGTVHAMMTMNYMDYTDDACMYMFSAGQKARMLAVFASGGPRYSMAQP